MKKRRQRTRAQIILEMRSQHRDKNTVIGMRVCQAIDILIYNDVYGWTSKEITDHLQLMDEYLQSYNAGNEDIYEQINRIRDELGIDLLGEYIIEGTRGGEVIDI